MTAAAKVARSDLTAGTITTADSAASSCSPYFDLSELASPFSGSTTDGRDDFDLSCGGNGQESVFGVELAPGDSITIGMDSNTYDSRHQTAWGGDCPGDNVVQCTDDPDTLSHSWTNDQGSVQNVYFVVDAYSSSSGDFVLSWTIEGCESGHDQGKKQARFDTVFLRTQQKTASGTTWRPPRTSHRWDFQPR
eukprot:SAG11_NODE_6539_length_1292_cov_2.891869_2_plen_192_part_00